MKKFNRNQHLELQIEKITSSGRGLARLDGAVFFVPFTAAGDHVKVRITIVKKNFYEAEVLEIISPGPERVAPKCVYYGRCGGCNLQHISQEGQLQAKTSILRDALENLFVKKIKDPQKKQVIGADPLPISLIQANPQFWNYRNRIQPIHKNGHFYFSRRNSNSLEAIKECIIAEAPLNAYLQKRPIQEPQGRLEIRINEQMDLDVYVMGEEPEGLGFSQVNRFQNTQLIEYVLLHLKEGEIIYDLYSGAGNFSFPIAKKFPNTNVIAVELSERLIKKAQTLNQPFRNIEFIHSDVKKFVQQNSLASYSKVLLDPPRIGCDNEVMKSLALSEVNQIIYISCNPSALARDLSVFFDTLDQSSSSSKWQIKDILPFEMFSQTDHLETIVNLERITI